MNVYMTFLDKRLYHWKAGLGIIMLFFILASGTSSEGLAQQVPIPPSRLIISDTVDFGDSARHGLINRLIQPFRFRENRLQRERDRVVELVRRLTLQGDLRIDSTTVEALVNDLLLITQEMAATRDSTSNLQAEVNRAILDLNTKAPQELVDSIQIQVGRVLQGLLDDVNTENIAARKSMAAKLSELRQYQQGCGSPNPSLQQATVGDTLLVTYQKCLNPKVRVFGWHAAWVDQEYINYNLNYLTDLILFGYDVAANGSPANEKELHKLLGSELVGKALSEGKTVSLSIYSKNPETIHNLLDRPASWGNLFAGIRAAVEAYGLGGINVYFEDVKPADKSKFSRFIDALSSELVEGEEAFSLTVSIPPISNSKDLANTNAYDFQYLNSKVDFYLVQTDKLNISNTRIPFAPTPLYPDQLSARGSVEGTFAFYTNGRIPIGKLVMTVSYLGISWPMPDFFADSRATGFGAYMPYQAIQEQLISQYSGQVVPVLGFDPVQVSSYLNYGTLGDLRQVWFEDGRSLMEKYAWALDNATGGVAVWGMGYDDGYIDLWDALGASLVQVDSMVVATERLNSPVPSQSLSFWDYLHIFVDDGQWAAINDIYIGNPALGEENYCEYKLYGNILSDSVLRTDSTFQRLVGGSLLAADQTGLSRKDLILIDHQVKNPWLFRSEYNSSIDPYSNYLASELECACIVSRWDSYAKMMADATLIILIALLVVVTVIFLGVQRYGDDWPLRAGLTVISFVLGVLLLVAGFFALFLDGEFTLFGAGSEAVPVWLLVIILLIGMSIGMIINKLHNSRKYEYKDLP